MSTLQLEVSQSLEGLSEDDLGFLLEMINKYMKSSIATNTERQNPSAGRRIGVLKGVQVFAPGYDFDEDNEGIARLFREVD